MILKMAVQIVIRPLMKASIKYVFAMVVKA